MFLSELPRCLKLQCEVLKTNKLVFYGCINWVSQERQVIGRSNLGIVGFFIAVSFTRWVRQDWQHGIHNFRKLLVEEVFEFLRRKFKRSLLIDWDCCYFS